MSKHFFLGFLTFFCTCLLWGQNNFTVSPTAIPKIGEINEFSTTFFSMIGKKQAGWVSQSEIQTHNPASYVFLDRPVFNMDLQAKWAFLRDYNGVYDSRQYYGIQNISIGFNVFKIWGTYLGLSPFSSNGYYYTQTNEAQNITKILEGSGGVYNLTWGNALLLFENQKHTVSLGFNTKYFFGNIKDFQKVNTSNTLINGSNFIYEESRFWNDVNFDLGVYYQINPNENWQFALGFTYTIGKAMRTQVERTEKNYLSDNNAVPVYSEAILFEKTKKKIYLPHSYSTGLTSRFKDKITLGTNFYYQDFARIKPIDTQVLSSVWQISTGLEFKPGGNYTVGLPILKRIAYRLGTDIGNIAKGNGMKYSVQTGLGIPILAKYLKSNMNLGLIYDYLEGTQLKNEQYLSLQLGFSLGPAAYENWFKRRPYY